MVRHARQNGAVVIGDIIPGHSGKGADFRLAERGYGDYPGLYHMVEIQPKDWSVLPPVPAGQGLGQPQARGGRRAQGARLHRRAAPTHHLLREERQGDRLVGHRRRRRGRREDAPLGLPPLLQGRAAHLQLAGSHLRRAAAGHGGRAPLPGHAGREHAAARRQWLPRHRGRSERRPRLVRGAPALGHLQPAHRRPGAQARWLHLPGAQPHPRGHQGHVPGWRRSLLRLRDPPRLPPRPRHRRCRIPASHARAPEDLPDRPGGPHPRAPEPRRAHPRAGALLDPPQGRHLHLPRPGR